MTVLKERVDVLIVGGGIAGAALACALSDTGLSILLIDRSDRPLDTARGDHLQPRTLEILRAWGILDHMVNAGAERRDATRWFDANGDLLLDVPVAALPIAFPYFRYLNHELIGETFLAGARRNEHFEAVRPVGQWTLEPEGDFPRMRIELPTGDFRDVEATVVVGADGVHSQVRKQARMDYELHRYVNPIAVLFGRYRRRNPDNGLRVYLGREHMVSVIPRTGGGCKIGLPLTPAEIREWRTCSTDEISRRVRDSVPDLEFDDLVFGAVYPPVRCHAPKWTQGRVVLVGDACHSLHPARSQGMNITIRCIDELVRQLPIDGGSLECRELPAALARFETAVRPGVERELASNHRAGQEMDNPERRSFEPLIEKLQQLQSSKEKLLAYAYGAAGYEQA